MRVAYTFPEVETMNADYEEQVPLSVIAENINREFHNGQQIRSAKSVSYVIHKSNHSDGWYENLEEKWLNSTKE